MKKRMFHAAALFFLVLLVQLLCLPSVYGAPGDFLFQWGAQQHFSDSSGVTVDGNGNVYVTDTSSVQVFNSAGTRIKKWGSYGSGDGQLSYPNGIAVDGSGNVYVVDTENHRVQVFDSEGNFMGKWGSAGTGNGQFTVPKDIAIDSNGNVYVSDTGSFDLNYSDCSVQVFDLDGNFLRRLGSIGIGNGQFMDPVGITVDENGIVYVLDANHYKIQVYNSTGNFIRIILVENFVSPSDVAVDRSGNVYVTDDYAYQPYPVKVIDSAGNLVREFGFRDYYYTEHYWMPIAIAVDQAGNSYTLDSANDGLRAFDNAGNPLSQWWAYGAGDGQFNAPTGIAVDRSGNVYETDSDQNRASIFNDRVRVFGSAGTFLKKWTSSQLSQTSRIAVDEGGNVYVTAYSEYSYRNVHVFDSAGNLLRQWGDFGSDPGQFYDPGGIAVSAGGDVYVVDSGNSRVQVFDNSGNFLRQFGNWGTGNGQFVNPEGIAIDKNGNIFVSDTGNFRIQVFDSAGNFLRKWGSSGFTNGRFSRLSGIAVDGNGNVFVADTGNNRIQVFDSLGIFIRKWGGKGDYYGLFNEPRGVAADRSGSKVYVADTGNNRIQAFAGYGNQLLPTPWVTSDIGTVGLSGSASYQNGTYSLSGSGADIWGTADGFRYVYQTLTGDGQIIARVASLQCANSWAKAGVMIRENLTANSSHAFMALTPGYGANFQRRITSGGSSANTAGPRVTAPYWVRLVRSGNTFSGYVSSNGVSWTLVGSDTIAMGDAVYVGLAVTNHGNTALCTATMDGVGMTVSAALPAAWATRDIGAVGLAGSVAFQNGKFSLSGSGADIWGTADAFRYVYHSITGDGQIIARVASLQNTNTWAKGGVMIRETLAANSSHALMALAPGIGATFQRRLTTGGTSFNTTGPSIIAPNWVRLVRSGNTINGYISSNGVNWTLVGSDTIIMANTVYIGLAVTSHNNAALCSVTMDGVQ